MRKRIGLFVAIFAVASLAFGASLQHIASATVPGVNTLISVNNTGNGQGGDANSPYDTNGRQQVLSANGRYVAFTSAATNLVSGDTNAKPDVFVRDLTNNTTTRVNVSTAGVEANDTISSSNGDKVAVSSTGRYVVFPSRATNLIDGQTISSPQIYMRDTVANTTSIVTQTSTGTLASRTPNDVNGVSSDGRFVIWSGTLDTNFAPGETNSSSYYVYVTDLSTKTTTVLNHTPASLQYFLEGVGSSCDGAIIAFSTKIPLTSDDTDSVEDVYIADLRNGLKITGVTTASFSTAGKYSIRPTVSCNGDYVSFISQDPSVVTTGPVATGTTQHVYLYDRINGSISLADTSGSGVVGNNSGGIGYSGVDDYGDVFFGSSSTNLIDGYTISPNEIYLKHRDTGQTEIATKVPGGSATAGASIVGGQISSSSNGKLIVYYASNSTSTTLLSSDTNGFRDVVASQTGL